MRKIIIIFLITSVTFALSGCNLKLGSNVAHENIRFAIDLDGGKWVNETVVLANGFKYADTEQVYYKETNPGDIATYIPIDIPGYRINRQICYQEKNGKRYYLNYFTDNLKTKTPFDLYERNKDNNQLEIKQINKNLTIKAIYNEYPGPTRIQNRNLFYGLDAPTPSTGAVKFLVLPLIFADETNSEVFINQLKDEFSQVADFFTASSNGLFTPQFIIPKAYLAKNYTSLNGSPFTPSLLTSLLNENASAPGGIVEYELIREVIKQEKNTLGLDNSFDLDGDNLLDALLVVYDIPSEKPFKIVGGQKVYSPFINLPKKFIDNCNIINNNDINLSFNTYGWFSGHQSELQQLDCFTKWHETIRQIGFLMGLDYYLYRDASKERKPLLPFLDVMTYAGFGDFNIASKIILGWVEPQIAPLVKGEITISPDKPLLLFPQSDHFSDYLAEYYLIDYYQFDAPLNTTFRNQIININTFLTAQGQLPIPYYSQSGYRVYHVDLTLNLANISIESQNILQLIYRNSIMDTSNDKPSEKYLIKHLAAGANQLLLNNLTNYDMLLFNDTNPHLDNVIMGLNSFKFVFVGNTLHIN